MQEGTAGRRLSLPDDPAPREPHAQGPLGCRTSVPRRQRFQRAEPAGGEPSAEELPGRDSPVRPVGGLLLPPRTVGSSSATEAATSGAENSLDAVRSGCCSQNPLVSMRGDGGVSCGAGVHSARQWMVPPSEGHLSSCTWNVLRHDWQSESAPGLQSWAEAFWEIRHAQGRWGSVGPARVTELWEPSECPQGHGSVTALPTGRHHHPLPSFLHPVS